jgi:hypothetical protein
MYWGNSESSLQPDDGAVFDTDNGFQGVWHLSDAVNDSVRDATNNGYNGTSPDSARPDAAEGVVGSCRMFDGDADYITMPNTADGELDFPENGTYTVCAWVLLDTFDNMSHCVVSKGYEQYYLRSTYIQPGMSAATPLWEFVEFAENGEMGNWRTSISPVEARQWTLVVGVRQGDRQLLYCNGELVCDSVDVWQNTVSRNTGNNLYIGRFAEQVAVPINEGYCRFSGGIDEVRISSTARSPDWIRLCYMNQRPDDRLVTFE